MIYITGDLHGETKRLYKIVKDKNMGAEDILIICGDFGFIWHDSGTLCRAENWTLDKLSRDIKCRILFIDGNHENFNKLYTFPEVELYGSKAHKIRENIYHLERGRLYTIEGKTFFTFGGAYSIDKYARSEGVSWWPQEIPSNEEYHRSSDTMKECGFNVDYIITHTAPERIIRAMGFSPDYHDRELTGYLDWLYHETEFEGWLFGHFHEDIVITPKIRALYNDVVTLE